jgi:VWFA-related protein
VGWRGEQPQFSLDANRIEITFSVTDRRGRFVALHRDDCTVYEDQRPQNIIEFTSESELPLRLAFLLDTGNRMRDRFGAIQDAASGFVRSSLRPGYDQAMLVSFDTTAEVVAPFCEGKQVAEEIRNLRPGGGTSLYDAIDLTARSMSEEGRGGRRYRFVIVVVSDGEDNESRLTRDQALEAAQRANAVLFAVSTSSQRVPSAGDRVLKYLTSETGGTALFPLSVEDFPHSFGRIAQELRHQHNVLYRPEPFHADGRFHVVEIRLNHPKGFVVRARKGYYAPGVLRSSGYSGKGT